MSDKTKLEFLTKLTELFGEYDADITPILSNGYCPYPTGYDLDLNGGMINIQIDGTYLDYNSIYKEMKSYEV